GVANQFAKYFTAAGFANVERDTFLVAVERQEGDGHPVDRRIAIASVVAAAGQLDLDDLGAHVAKNGRGVGAGDHARQVDDADVIERLGHQRRVSLSPNASRAAWCALSSRYRDAFRCAQPQASDFTISP